MDKEPESPEAKRYPDMSLSELWASIRKSPHAVLGGISASIGASLAQHLSGTALYAVCGVGLVVGAWITAYIIKQRKKAKRDG
jgi:hypothetical protein